MSEFKREERYVVFKLTDLNEIEKTLLRNFISKYLVKTRECVVVESDWPEYEATWEALQSRMLGAPSKYETAIPAFQKWYVSAPHEELSNATVAVMAFKEGVAHALRSSKV